MISLRFDKNKKEKKINFKVIATGVVAITLIGIVGISIGRYGGNNPIGDKFVLDIIEPIGKNLNSGFTFLRDNFKDIINYKSNSKKLESLQDENEKLKIINSIVNTLTNLKEINSIKILVNGSENENFSDEYLRIK